MEFLNRYIDRPLLDAGSAAMRLWHNRTGHSPQKLGPLLNLVVILALLSTSSLLLNGPIYLFALGTLLLLAVPSLRLFARDWTGWSYDIRSYQALATAAARKREAEWATRLTVLLTATVFPFCVSVDDPAASIFLLGASLWFVLTAPVKMYLDAAEPPPPDSGGTKALGRRATMAV
ncbi:hypothetical protein G6M50_10120 [Agrobacterium rhizogenes]|jgi:hypothetical protein|nr:hypothetical protein [Rhizobium rhizogenes]NTJ78142.1 hypothetical protein [Rhizobium rhizogenes]